MTSYFNLLKYAATGIASPDMTYYDRMRASTLMGGVVQTLTGIPPLSFPSDGSPLISWSMKGNGSQSGTPTSDNPVMPTFCGVRTAQIIDYTLSESGGIDASGNPSIATNLWRSNTFYEIHGDIFLSFVKYSTLQIVRVNYYDENYSHISREEFSSDTPLNIPINAKYFKWTLYASSGTIIDIDFVRQCYIMLNTGSTALPYEPYGWAEKITRGGETTPVYLGQTQTVRKIRRLVLTGEEENWTITMAGNTPCARIGVPETASTEGNINRTPVCTHYIGSYSDANGRCRLINSITLQIADSVHAVDLPTWTAYLADQYAAGTPVTVWYVLANEQTGISNAPLAKIGDYCDELNSEDAAVTIPTVKGNNTLTVGGDLQPSEMTITFKG